MHMPLYYARFYTDPMIFFVWTQNFLADTRFVQNHATCRQWRKGKKVVKHEILIQQLNSDPTWPPLNTTTSPNRINGHSAKETDVWSPITILKCLNSSFCFDLTSLFRVQGRYKRKYVDRLVALFPLDLKIRGEVAVETIAIREKIRCWRELFSQVKCKSSLWSSSVKWFRGFTVAGLPLWFEVWIVGA